MSIETKMVDLLFLGGYCRVFLRNIVRIPEWPFLKRGFVHLINILTKMYNIIYIYLI